MAKLEDLKTSYRLGFEITQDGKVTKTLNTAGTYVDRNINVEVDVKDATYEVKADNTITATASVNDEAGYLTDTQTNFPIELQADASVTKATVGVAQAGFAASTDTVDVSAKTATADKRTKYIKAGSLADPSALTMAVEGGNGVEVTKVGVAPESGFYIKTSANGTVSVETSGWIPAETSKNVAGEAYYTIPSVSLSNQAEADAIYTDISENAPILVSGDFLYIKEGYIENSKISLAKLVPNESNVVGKNDLVYKTVSVYDNDGNLVAGSMQDAELSAITANNAKAEFKTVAVAANTDNSAFKVTGQTAISGTTNVAISKTGYATTDLSQTGVITGTATVDATLAKGALKATVTNDGTVKPVIKNDGSNALVGAVSVTAPEGKKYVAVSTDAIAKTVNIAPQVASEGYVTTTVFDATAATAVAGAEAADKVYIPIENGSHSVSHTQDVVQEQIVISMEDSITSGYSKNGVLAIAPAEGPYLQINTSNTHTSGSVTSQASCTTTEGYILSGTDKDTAKTTSINAQVTQAASKYIKVYTGDFTE